MEYRAISLMSLAEAGLEPSQSRAADGRSRTILEIGCATGALLSSFAEAGWIAGGIEVGPSMAAYARSEFGLDVAEGTIETARPEAGRFDAVIATHLIEHLNEPRTFLAEARRALRADGRLYLVTPNSDGLQAVLMGERWRSAIRDHLYLFSARTLKALLSSEGFRVEYSGTWGGWPAGMRPSFLKRPLDAMAKRHGWGDVMVVRACLARP
jgi:2-polyprenyl-3-methyl-5-hydroxy-6-metoxy-1,4-benzoquinol methylase